jgi:hypothetical protein|tara:strand:- start:459 stop:1052 length:594 start_codon:yes stop_codon:yes gene_type:complete
MNDFNMLGVLEEEHEKTAASGVEGIGQNALASVADVARQMRLQEQEVGLAKEALKQAETEMRRLTDDVMPTLFSELGLQSFKLEDGSELKVKQTYSATPLVANRPQVYQWLHDNGYGDLIKNTVFCTFGRDEEEDAKQFYSMAESRGYCAETKREVHASTLRAFVKERVEAGDEFPMELFGAWVGQRATISKTNGVK